MHENELAQSEATVALHCHCLLSAKWNRHVTKEAPLCLKTLLLKITFSFPRNSRSRLCAVCNSAFGRGGGGTPVGVPAVRRRSNKDPQWWRGIGVTDPTCSVAKRSATLSGVDWDAIPLEVGRRAVGRTTSTLLGADTGTDGFPFYEVEHRLDFYFVQLFQLLTHYLFILSMSFSQQGQNINAGFLLLGDVGSTSSSLFLY